MYTCPDCKSPLVDLRCERCAHVYQRILGFPQLLPTGPDFESAREIVDAYEAIYTDHSNVWENQGRSREFIRYFAGLLNGYKARRVLEVGCGEGILLAEIDAPEKYATELAARALEKASARTQATLSLALCERLPYPDGVFDLVTSVGVMEHFIDDRAATREVSRVLHQDGRYVVLIHVQLTTLQSIRQKISEYVFPRPHPIRLARWLAGKFHKSIHQPVQNNYSLERATACIQGAGFMVERRVMKANTPAAPLVGPDVVIFVCRKIADSVDGVSAVAHPA